jgi:hypothetical protein
MGIIRTDTIIRIVITDRIGTMATITGRIIGPADTVTIATIVIIPTVIVIIGNDSDVGI